MSLIGHACCNFKVVDILFPCKFFKTSWKMPQFPDMNTKPWPRGYSLNRPHHFNVHAVVTLLGACSLWSFSSFHCDALPFWTLNRCNEQHHLHHTFFLFVKIAVYVWCCQWQNIKHSVQNAVALLQCYCAVKDNGDPENHNQRVGSSSVSVAHGRHTPTSMTTV